MRRFAQIENGNEVRTIIEADDPPVFAPYVQLVEITGLRPAPCEGWQYENGRFVEPPSIASPAQPEPSQGLAVDGFGTVDASVLVTKFLVEPGGHMGEHVHEKAHGLIVKRGPVRVFLGGVASDAKTGDFVLLPARVPHRWEADQQGAVVYTVHLRDSKE